MLNEEVVQSANRSVAGLFEHIKRARADEAAYAQTEFLDKGIPYLIASTPLLGEGRQYRILMPPTGKPLQRNRRGPKGLYSEDVVFFRRKAAVRRWLEEKKKCAETPL